MIWTFFAVLHDFVVCFCLSGLFVEVQTSLNQGQAVQRLRVCLLCPKPTILPGDIIHFGRLCVLFFSMFISLQL